MSQDLPEKISRTISDFLQINALVNSIEHELEKRIVARHGTVKLDALVPLLAQYKNILKSQLSRGATTNLEGLIARLRRDLSGSPFEVGRDALSAHALKLDLERIVVTWKFMGKTTFSILCDDLKEIDAELQTLSTAYSPAPTVAVDPSWRVSWRDPSLLDEPQRLRVATIYPGLATKGVGGALPGGAPAQDAIIRACGLATFLLQTSKLLSPIPNSSRVHRLLWEQMVNDFMALWELLFDNTVTNNYGAVSDSVVGYWERDGYAGAADLRAIEATKHLRFDALRIDVRNKHTAHIDPNIEHWKCAVRHWPIALPDLDTEIFRVLNAVRGAARRDIRTRFFFSPPAFLDDGVLELSGQEGLAWDEA